MARRAIAWVMGAAIAMVAVRAFVAVGLVPPVVVHGSSMAPTLRGAGAEVACPACNVRFWVGDDQRPAGDAVCPVCRGGILSDQRRTAPDELFIDRLKTPPRRWDVVVHRSPDDATQWCVKRVLGLPGEAISIHEGDLWIDGRRVVKSLDHQLKLRQRVLDHRLQPPVLAPTTTNWRQTEQGWNCSVREGKAPASLVARVEADDFVPGNLAAPRQLVACRDLMLDLLVEPTGSFDLRLGIECGSQSVQAGWNAEGWAELQAEQGALRTECPISVGRASHCVLSTFDRQALLAIDGAPLLKLPLTADGTSPEVVLTVRSNRGEAQIWSLSVWRDVYYEAGAPVGGKTDRWRLEPDEFFVVGDNQAASLDSRNWRNGPGVPEGLLIGGVRGR